MNRIRTLHKNLQERIVFLDGAMGTMIQQCQLQEADFRGERFKEHHVLLKGNNDLLNLTKPEIIRAIHREYALAGADIIETNTFNSTSISLDDYQLSKLARELNEEGARLAREVANEIEKENPDRTVWVAGSMGPTNKTASLSPDVNRPAMRAVTFDQLRDAYREQIEGLVAGGVDLLLMETVFDTLNLKAAIRAYLDFKEENSLPVRGESSPLPLMISVTVTDLSGRTLTGLTLEAFWNSVRHAHPLSIGLNCAFGAKQMRAPMADLARVVDETCRAHGDHVYLSCYPNAGLPNPLAPTGYDEHPCDTAGQLAEFAAAGLVNIVGGCCGTTPAHIEHIREDLEFKLPRKLPEQEKNYGGRGLRLAGLEPFNLLENRDNRFIMVGERTNVMGSPKFAKAVKEKNDEEALKLARQQVENGANIIDINFDEGLLDSVEEMTHFLRLIASEPDIARVPIMIDSSDYRVIEAALKNIQGKPIVNSISLKEGEAKFIWQAKEIMKYGAAVVVMAFDEKGQAATLADKVRICERAYKLLTNVVGMDASDIVFDPNVLTVATGMEEHASFGIDFIEAVRMIKQSCPHAFTSGGISNVSFSFRGNNQVREAMHSAFLFHAIHAGLDMGIVNAGMIQIYEDIAPELKEKVEDVLLNRHEHATENLITLAKKILSKGEKQEKVERAEEEWRQQPYAERMAYALIHGILDHVEEDTNEAFADLGEALKVIEGPLMEGMKRVGDLFGAGKMFLPQVVKSARVMKRAVAVLEPHMQALNDDLGVSSKKTFVIATVKGDVHDIGKNIVSVVLACNGYRVIDMGVMVNCEAILAKAREVNADFVGFSGLITPSLMEMIFNAGEMEREQFKVPLLIGGATTNREHTAIKIAPHYSGGPVVHVGDASLVVGVCSKLMSEEKELFVHELKEKQGRIRDRYLNKEQQNPDLETLSLPQARERAEKMGIDWNTYTPPIPRDLNDIGKINKVHSIPLESLIPYIDWSPLFWVFELKGKFPQILESSKYGEQARSLYEDAQGLLAQMTIEKLVTPQAVWGLWPAKSDGDDIELLNGIRFHFLRQQKIKKESTSKCLADFVAPAYAKKTDYFGAFVVTAGTGIAKLAHDYEVDQKDDYNAILVKAIGDRLAEAAAEWLHKQVRNLWGFGEHENLSNEDLILEKYRGIRPAPGYPSCPDHTEKAIIWQLLEADQQINVHLTENFAMTPPSSVTGFYFSHEKARYFNLGKIEEDQVADYAKRKNMSIKDVEKWLAPNILDAGIS